jgi:hypothetical protein
MSARLHFTILAKSWPCRTSRATNPEIAGPTWKPKSCNFRPPNLAPDLAPDFPELAALFGHTPGGGQKLPSVAENIPFARGRPQDMPWGAFLGVPHNFMDFLFIFPSKKFRPKIFGPGSGPFPFFWPPVPPPAPLIVVRWPETPFPATKFPTAPSCPIRVKSGGKHDGEKRW